MESADERVIIEHINLLAQQMEEFKYLRMKHARAMKAAREAGNRIAELSERIEAEKYGALYEYVCDEDTFLRRLVGWN